jgi:hypothetical protein
MPSPSCSESLLLCQRACRSGAVESPVCQREGTLFFRRFMDLISILTSPNLFWHFAKRRWSILGRRRRICIHCWWHYRSFWRTTKISPSSPKAILSCRGTSTTTPQRFFLMTCRLSSLQGRIAGGRTLVCHISSIHFTFSQCIHSCAVSPRADASGTLSFGGTDHWRGSDSS